MSSVRFQAKGLNEILSNLEGLPELTSRAGRKALEAAARPVLDAVHDQYDRNVREKTGKLRKAIKVGKRKQSKGSQYIEVGVFKGEAPHAHLVEFGHGGPAPAPPHSFLRSGYEQGKGEAEAVMGETVKREMGL